MFISTPVVLKGCNNRVLAYYLSEKGKQELAKVLRDLPLIYKAINDVSNLKWRVDVLEHRNRLLFEALDAQIIQHYYLKLCLVIQGLSPTRSYRETDINRNVDVAPNTYEKYNEVWQRVLDEKVLVYRGSGWYRRGAG